MSQKKYSFVYQQLVKSRHHKQHGMKGTMHRNTEAGELQELLEEIQVHKKQSINELTSFLGRSPSFLGNMLKFPPKSR